MHKTLQKDEFEVADFKYIFKKIPAQKYPNKAILIGNLRIFNFPWNFFENFEVASDVTIIFFFKCQPKGPQTRQLG